MQRFLWLSKIIYCMGRSEEVLEKGRVLFDRKITSWRWYKNEATFKLFFHLVITANYKDMDFEDIVVKRGQRIASIATLATETGLTEKRIRTALKHLKETDEVASLSTPKYTVFTINNYNRYQKWANGKANEGQTEGELRANEGQQCNKRIIKDNKRKKNSTPPGQSFDPYGGGRTDF